MKYISKFISVLISMILIVSALSGLCVNAVSIAQSTPYFNDFDTEGYQPLESDGFTVTGLAEGATVAVSDGKLAVSGISNVTDSEGTTKNGLKQDQFVNLNLTPVTSGTIVVEAELYVTDTDINYNFNASNGLFNVFDSSDKMVANTYLSGRGGTYVTSNGIGQNVSGSWSGTQPSWGYNTENYGIKYEIDLGNKKWRGFRADGGVDKEYVQYTTTEGVSEFSFADTSASNIAKLQFALVVNGMSVDKINVYKKVEATQITKNFEINPGEYEMLANSGLNITTGNVRDFTFKSDNTSVAKVAANGRITAKDYGTAIVTAVNEYNSLKFVFAVSVTKPAEKITIDQAERVLFVGESFRLTYSTPNNQKAGNVTWSSSNNSVATVGTDGVVNAVGEGTAVIKATSQYGVFADYVVEVVTLDDSVTDINVNSGDMSFDSGSNSLLGWTGGTEGTSTQQVVSGGANGTAGCLKLDVTSEDGDRYAQQYFGKNDINPGDRYTLSCMVNVEKLEDGAVASITVGCNERGYYTTKHISSVTGEWKKVYVDFLVPEGGNNLSFMLRMQGIGTVYYDEVRITRQKDSTEVRLFSDGLALNSLVKDAPLATANIHYVPKITGDAELIAATYDGEILSDFESITVTADTLKTQTVDTLIDYNSLDENKIIGIMNWDNLESMKPLQNKHSLFNKTQRSDVYNFFEINRMRGVYGGLSDIYSDEVKSLITDYGINTLIPNIIGTFYGKNVLKDMFALDKVLTDAEALADETGVKVLPKISYGSGNATINNTKYGEFHSGSTLIDKNGVTVDNSGLPCPRARQYWKEQVTDVLSVVASHRKLPGGVVDLEMYSGYRTSYGGTCKCDTCASDFDSVYGTHVAAQTITERYKYLKDNNLLDKYTAWHKSEIIEITSEVRDEIHNINPDFIIGYMPQIEWIAGITEGLGTHKMPAMIFNEQEYRGNLSKMYVNQATIRMEDLPAVYATGLWSDASNAIAAADFEAKAVEAAENSVGYWIYASQYLTGDATDKDLYKTAIKKANSTINDK